MATETVPAETVHANPARPSAEELNRPKGATRIIGIDLARGLALIGMITAHFGLSQGPELMDPATWGGLVNGRSSVLFAVLAGVSLAIITGRHTPYSGPQMANARIKIVVRALCIIAIGALLTGLNSNIAIILQTYGFLFITAIPLLRLKRWQLAGIAFCWAIIGPFLVAVLEPALEAAGLSLPFAGLLIWDTYPALTWFPYIVMGLAVGRMDLARWGNALFLLIVGALIAILGYTSVSGLPPASSELELGQGTGIDQDLGTDLGSKDWTDGALEETPEGTFIDESGNKFIPFEEFAASQNLDGQGLTGDEYISDRPGDRIIENLSMWNSAEPHSNTPFEIIGSGGFAVAVIGFCLLIGSAVRVIFAPIIALGTMSLTVYTVHVFSFRIMQDSVMATDGLSMTPWLWSLILLGLGALIWQKTLGRGPLERLVTAIVNRTVGGPSNT